MTAASAADPADEADLERATERALAMRERLGLAVDASPQCWLAVVEQGLGVEVVVARLPRSISGAYVPGEGGPVVLVNGAHAVVHQRFALAHQLGHHVLGHGPTPWVLRGPDAEPLPVPGPTGTGVDPSSTQGPTVSPGAQAGTLAREREADAFGGELLIPRAALPRVLQAAGHPPGDPALDLEVVVRLAATFAVSAHLVLERLQTAGLVPEATRAALQTRLRARDHLRLHSTLGLQAHRDTLAAIAEAGPLPRLPDRADRSSLLDRLRAGADPLAARERELRELLGMA